MSKLSKREIELVAIGAAVGSSCEPCLEYHIPESLNAGLTISEIDAAISFADRLRQTPSRKALNTAKQLLESLSEENADNCEKSTCGCG